MVAFITHCPQPEVLLANITNNHGVPLEYVLLAEDNGHVSSGNDFSVTTLIDAPQVRWLREKNPWAYDSDVSDRIAAMIGSGIHKVFEDAAIKVENAKVEVKIVVEVLGKKIAGKIDKIIYHEDGSVSVRDLKVVRSDSLKYGDGARRSWIDQLNMYAAMLRISGFKIRDLGVDLIIKDWTKGQIKYNPRYPVSPIKIVDVPMLEPADAASYLEERVKLHMQDPPPECTQVEYWGQNPKYAVYEKFKNGGLKKRANRVLDSSIDADAYIADNRLSAVVEVRPGRRVRCEENYCGVASICKQYWKALEVTQGEEVYDE